MIGLVSVQRHSRHSVVSLGKTLCGTFLCLVVLASSSSFQSYFNKTNKKNKKFQADNNTLASPEAGRGNCLPYALKPPSLSYESGG